MTFYLLPFVAAVPLLLSAAFGFVSRGVRPKGLRIFAEAGALAALLASLSAVAALAVVGPGIGTLVGAHGLGLSARLDAVSASMLRPCRFSIGYSKGEGRGRFSERIKCESGCCERRKLWASPLYSVCRRRA